MNDERLDGLLSRLPQEAAAPDLAARIILAVAMRRQARLFWLRVGIGSGVCGLAGLGLLAVSWAEAAAVTEAIPSTVDTAALMQTLAALLADPFNTFIQWVNAGLSWQAALAEGAGVALTIAVALLATAALGGLARMLVAAVQTNGGSAGVAQNAR